MFTKDELLERYQTVSLLPLEHLQVQRFGSRSHASHISIESGYTVCRGNKEVFIDPVQFYCECLIEWDAEGQEYEGWKEGWRGWLCNGVDDAVCRRIIPEDFVREIKQLLELGHRSGQSSKLIQLPSMDEFVAALQMSDEWNDISILAEFKHEFIYVHWHTSA